MNKKTPIKLDSKNYVSFSAFDINGKKSDIPQPTESINNEGWINWGKDNLYPNYLIELTQRSAIHNAIVDLKASMIGGNGFIDAEWADDTISLINNANNAEEDLEEIYSKLAIDLTIFNGYALEIDWNKEGTKIARIQHLPFECIRVAKQNEKYPEHKEYYVSSDWKHYKKPGNEPVKYSAFDTNIKKGAQILYVKHYRAGTGIYPIPEYIAGIVLCELNAEINTFHLSTVQNQFSPSFLINIPELPINAEQGKEIVERTKDEYQGTKNAGKVIVSFSNGADQKPTIETIPMNDNDKRFKELTKWMMDGIFVAHKVTDQSMFGIETAGRLGGRNNLLEALSVFQAQYISTKQKFLEKQLKRFTRVNGIRDKILLENYKINIDPDFDLKDMTIFLSATLLTPKQKVAVLMSKGFTREKALDLVDSGNTDNKPIEPPTATTQPQVVPKSNTD